MSSTACASGMFAGTNTIIPARNAAPTVKPTFSGSNDVNGIMSAMGTGELTRRSLTATMLGNLRRYMGPSRFDAFAKKFGLETGATT